MYMKCQYRRQNDLGLASASGMKSFLCISSHIQKQIHLIIVEAIFSDSVGSGMIFCGSHQCIDCSIQVFLQLFEFADGVLIFVLIFSLHFFLNHSNSPVNSELIYFSPIISL